MANIKWTEDAINLEAKKYSTRTEFARGSRAYNAAHSRGILDVVCAHMEAGRQPKYTIAAAKNAASLCRNQMDFKLKHPELHAFAYRTGNMEYVCSGLAKKRVWSDEDLVAEAAKYKTLGEFKNGSPSAYNSLRRDDKMELKLRATAHMTPVHMSWTNQTILDEALNYETRIDFKAKSAGAYQAALLRGIVDEVCSHMTRFFIEWDEDKIRSEALKFTTRGAFAKESPGAYSAAGRRGVLDEVCAHMDAIFTYWSVESATAAALLYTTKAEFALGNPRAYQAAGRFGITDKVCAHMVPAFEWDEGDLIAIVDGMSSLTELIRTRPEVYQALKKRGICKRVTAHLPRGKNGFKPNLVTDFYAYRINTRHQEYLGFGITNDIATRHPRHVNTVNRYGATAELLFSYKTTGEIAQRLERVVKQTFPIVDTGIQGFRTEAIVFDTEFFDLLHCAAKQANEMYLKDCHLTPK